MRAIGYYRPLPISDDQSLVDLELPEPVPGTHDLRVSIRAVSVNPVDVKVRTRPHMAPRRARRVCWVSTPPGWSSRSGPR